MAFSSSLSPDQQHAVISLYEGGMSPSMLAQYFAVSIGEIYRALRKSELTKNTWQDAGIQKKRRNTKKS